MYRILHFIHLYVYIQVHLQKFEYGEKVHFHSKVKLSYILDSLHVK